MWVTTGFLATTLCHEKKTFCHALKLDTNLVWLAFCDPADYTSSAILWKKTMIVTGIVCFSVVRKLVWAAWQAAKYTSVEMLYLQFQLSLMLILWAIALLKLISQWWLQEPHAHWMHYHYHSHACMQVTICYSSKTVGVGYVHRVEHVHMQARHMPDQTHYHQWYKPCAQAKAAMLWNTCSQDFTRSAVYLVVQMELSRWKVVQCVQLTLHWTLNCWQ